ncbi:MAG: HEPN domain-containing protein, partial [Ignavibacteria bacterium]|nr:HEPN domain-containing protein [Ignavibacteria bacterium]
SQSEIESIIEGLISVLIKTPVESRATVQLVGIILQPDEIELGSGIKIRRPKKEDFEIERRMFHSFPEPQFLEPTAFLEISKNTGIPMEIQTEVKKAVTLLQLFRLGSVNYISYRMYSSFRNLFGNVTVGTAETNHPVYTYIIRDGESEKLQNFCTALSERLPSNIYQLDGLAKDHISIAYDRYEDALIQIGIDERRITNIMMGLEALYFKQNERQELDYRLQMRMAKVLGLLSIDSILVKNLVKDAYNIRSIFSHGGLLDAKKRELYQKKYDGGVGDLTKIMLDFLRISLIVSMIIEMDKTEFIDLIDNALIQESDNKKLENVLDLTDALMKLIIRTHD